MGNFDIKLSGIHCGMQTAMSF